MNPKTFREMADEQYSQPTSQQFGQVFQKVGPYARGFGPEWTGMPVAQQTNNFQGQGFLDKVRAVAGQTADIVGSVGKSAGRFAVNSVVDIAKQGALAARSAYDAPMLKVKSESLAYASNVLDIRMNEAAQAYKSGKMSKEDYIKTLQNISTAQQDLGKELAKVSSGPSPTERAAAVAETALNVLTFGSLTLGKSLAKTAGKETFEALLKNSTTDLEKAIIKIPAVKGLLERNMTYIARREAQKLAGESSAQFLAREGKHIAAALLVKRPLFYQMNIGDANQVYQKILSGNYTGALTTSAWMGSQMLNGGPLGAFMKLSSSVKRNLSELSYGVGSFVDEVSRKVGVDITKELRSIKDPEEFKRVEKIWRILQEGNLRAAGEDAATAADNFLSSYLEAGDDFARMSKKKIRQHLEDVAEKWQKADELWDSVTRKGLINGITRTEARKYTPVRWDQSVRDGLANKFRNAPEELQGRAELLQKLANQPGAGWANNELLMEKLNEILSKELDGAGIQRAIKAIDAAGLTPDLPKRIAAQFNKLGYTIAMPKGGRLVQRIDYADTRKLITAAVKQGDEVFDMAIEPMPELRMLTGFLEKAGLSPKEAGPAATKALSAHVVASLDDVNLRRNLGFVANGNDTTGGTVILSKLKQYVDNMKPNKVLNVATGYRNQAASVTDIRQLTPWEIAEALSGGGTRISVAEGRKISKAIMKGYLDTPMEFRGLGDRVVDALYAINPAQKYYSRAQSALRYTYNPFFRIQESVETGILSTAKGGSRLTNLIDHNLIWNRSRKELNEASKILDATGIFESSLPGEAAQDLVLGRLTANITPGQKRDIAGLALDIARSQGTDIATLARDSPGQLADALRVVVQYPRKGLLASPLARTLNVAFFPMRYNAKVTKIAAEVIAQQPPAIQKAVLHSLFTMKDWLKSDEGIRWQSEHADAIKVFNWVTPVNSISYTMKLLKNGPESWGDMGALGGLPLGVISQILDSQGVINLNRPYLDPGTGEVLPKYIPDTLKARASVALIDLLGSTFNYPGRVLGLPGKQASIREFVRNFIATNGEDFDKKIDTERLTPLQKQWIKVLKGDTSDEAVDALYNMPAEGEYRGYTLPPLDLPILTPDVQMKLPKMPKQRTKRVARSMPGR